MQLLIDPRGTCPLPLRRGDRPVRARRRWPSAAPATSSPTTPGAGGPTCRRSAAPRLGPFDRRSEALEAERVWLEQCLLGGKRIGDPLCADRGSRGENSTSARIATCCFFSVLLGFFADGNSGQAQAEGAVAGPTARARCGTPPGRPRSRGPSRRPGSPEARPRRQFIGVVAPLPNVAVHVVQTQPFGL